MYGQVALKMPRWIERLAVVLITAVLAVVTGAVLLQGEEAAALTPETPADSQRGSIELMPARRGEGANQSRTVEVDLGQVVPKKPASERAVSPMQASASAAPKVADGGESTRYRIRAGDRLEALARKHYQSPLAVRAILDANPGLDPLRLQIGQEITLPEWQHKSAATSKSLDTAAAPSGARWLAIKAGDTLESLARIHLGRRSDWPKLAALNAEHLKDPHRLQVGQKLLVPVAPAGQSAKPKPLATR